MPTSCGVHVPNFVECNGFWEHSPSSFGVLSALQRCNAMVTALPKALYEYYRTATTGPNLKVTEALAEPSEPEGPSN